ncbi:Serine/threonine-protein kinase PrkC [Aquisphaera giovannonii]|uniref:non-specific serine/threonine protein kinase n=1 Tax=Aquisphaera giovannonii TaxID=406548 RepID=A0A5B9WBJ3_9BACT|nr:serine/threonine-protein kinase [Aquisphaera giovannonii]QEH37877.1 Serine/threonine-protein kinase PrkC [Aquisphaera giovannonii]
MQTPDDIAANEPSSHAGGRAPTGAGAGVAPGGPQDPPTVVRSSSSMARKLQGQPATAPPAPVMLPRLGEAVDTFVLEEAIGVGGMGAVFRALDAQLDRHVALKMLPLDQTDDPEIVQRFYQEGRSSAQLDHENIARVYSIGQDGPYHYIAFEYIEGVTVRRRVDEKGPLPPAETVDIALQIAQALVHASERGVVHRDIKPSNIILTPQGRAKLVDMGLARRFERDADHGLTQSGMTLGTFDYISPEQARDPRDVDVRSDLYSLGCTMFHMLAGQPPFPGGTVLQKLLQHQEEPAPDIRGLNPSVPVELARLVAKLLAKDRDRRYQTPEQVARDLLVIAGQMGMPVIPSDAHPWASGGHRVTWERHLAWLLPGLAFVAVIGLLAWWSRELNDPAAGPALPSPRTSVAESAGAAHAPAPFAGSVAKSAGTAEDARPLPAPPPRNIAVRPGEDLLAVLAAAPPRAVVTLTEDGPFLVGGRSGGHRGAGPLDRRDLTIRADSGARPVLRFAADSGFGEGAGPPGRLVGAARDGGPEGDGQSGSSSSAALLWFAGGNVTIEGLTFELDGEGPAVQTALIGEDTALTVRGCMFRQISRGEGRDRTAIRTRPARSPADAADRDRPPRLLVETSHFDGFQVGVASEGALDLVLRDCTFGPCSPAIRVENRVAGAAVPVDIRLRHASFMAGNGPVLDFEGALARVQAEDCVVAPAAGTAAILVAVDSPRDLEWQGRSNLYYRVRTFLKPTREADEARAIDDFDDWRDAPGEIRETDSLVANSPVWNSARPLQDLIIEQGDPTEAFSLSPALLATDYYGARQGPYGARTLEPPRGSPQPRSPATAGVEATAGAAAGAATASPLDPSIPKSPRPDSEPPAALAAGAGATNPASKPAPAAAGAGAARGGGEAPQRATIGPWDPMRKDARPPSPADVAGFAAGSPAPGRTPAAADAAVPATRPRPAARVPSDEEDVIRSAEQFANSVARFGERGGILKIARDVDLDLPPTEFGGGGDWVVQAEDEGSRPRIRLRSPTFASRAPSSWTTLFGARSGSLEVRGLDLILPEQESEIARANPQAAVAVSPGARLNLVDCTITVADRSPRSAAIVLPPADAAQNATKRGIPEASVVVADCFLRACGDAISVSSGRPLDLQLRNVLVATDGSLLRASGEAASSVADAFPLRSPSPTIRVKIERSTARTKGGLVYLESTPDQDEPPLTAIDATNSILTTAGQEPLFRVDGQGPMERLRDRIAWKADRVAYVQITTYRRDQVRQTGVSPRDYTRSDWRTAFDPTDILPIVDGLKFRTRPDSGRTACSLSREDLTLDAQGPGRERGPDLARVPAPPPADS